MTRDTQHLTRTVRGGAPSSGGAAARLLLGCACGFFSVAPAAAEDSLEERVRALLAASHSGSQVAGTNEAPARVRVFEGRAAVFASTNASREALVWLPEGSELSVRGELPDESVWVRVEPPDSVSVWIYRELVRDGVVVADKSRMRSGAGLTFRTMGSLRKGARVEVRGTYGDWLKIKPPGGLDFWMLRDQVEAVAVMPSGGPVADVDPPSAAEPEEGATNRAPAVLETAGSSLASAADRPAPVRPVPPEMAGALLADVPGQGSAVSLTGVLDWGAVGDFSAPFCLVARQADGDTLPLCHVFAPASQANPHVGARVALEGSRWQVKGVALPVMVVHALRPVD